MSYKYNPNHIIFAVLLSVVLIGCSQQSVKSPTQTQDHTDRLQHKNKTGTLTPAPQKHETQKQTLTKSTASKNRTPKTSRPKPSRSTASLRHPVEVRSSQAAPKAIIAGRSFKLNYHQQRFFPEAGLAFKIVSINDHRCPIESHCIQQGNATVALDVIREDTHLGIIKLHTGGSITINNLEKNITALEGYNVEIVTLRPYPTELYTEHDRYIAELIIHKQTLNQ